MPSTSTRGRVRVIGTAVVIIAVASGLVALGLLLAPPSALLQGRLAVAPPSSPSPRGPDAAFPTDVPEPTAVPTPPPTPVLPEPTDEPAELPVTGELPSLTEFVRSCGESLVIDRPGQVSYPRVMQIAMGASRTYDAAIDVRAIPAHASEVISAAHPAQGPVTVQCVVAARLVAVGDGIRVAVPDEALDGGWSYQRFTELGVVEWAWSVSPQSPDDQQLRLELRPAARGNDIVQLSSTATAHYTTEVAVTASTLQTVWYWFQTEWKLLGGVLGVLGAGLLALLQFSQSLRDSLSKAFGRRAAPPGTSGAAADDAGSTGRGGGRQRLKKKGRAAGRR